MLFRFATLTAAFSAFLLVAGANAAPITKQVTIRPIGLCDDNGSNCAVVNTYNAAANAIWAQAGIQFTFLPALSWDSTAFNSINSDTSEELSMFQFGSAMFGNPLVTGVINMYFVDTVTSSSGTLYGEGCGGSVFAAACNNQAGVLINATAVNAYNSNVGRIDTPAHEVGHLLNLTHTDYGAGVCNNLMSDGNTRCIPGSLSDIATLDQLTQQQITVALRSPFLTDAVPEPASLVLLGVGLIGTGLARRRRRAA